MRTIRKYMPQREFYKKKFHTTNTTMTMKKFDRNYKKMRYEFHNLDGNIAIMIVITCSPDETCTYICDSNRRPVIIFHGKELIEIHVDNIMNFATGSLRYDITVWPQLTSVPSKYYYGKRAHVTAHCGYIQVHQWFGVNGAPELHYARCDICGREEDLACTIPIERIMRLSEHVMTHDVGDLVRYFD